MLSEGKQAEKSLYALSKHRIHTRKIATIKNTKLKRFHKFQVSKIKIHRKKSKALHLQEVKPPSRFRNYYSQGSDEANLEQATNKEITYLFKLLKKNRSAEFLLRLGSLYVEKSRFISDKIYMDYDKKSMNYQAGLTQVKPYLDLKIAKGYNTKSLKLFKDFKQRYPNHPRMDEVLFFLGFNFYQLKKSKQAVQYFVELETRFPKSIYLYESQFQLGEHYFQLRDWKNSFKYYRKISRNKSGKFYFFALYKMAWSAYKMNRVSQGLYLLKRIIIEARSSNFKSMFNFTKDAKQDLVLFYASSKKPPSQAELFFVNFLDKEQASLLVEKLAYSYRNSSSTKGAVTLFQDLIDKNPSGKKSFQYVQQIVEMLYESGTISKFVKYLKHWVIDYGPNSSWAQANSSNKNFLKKSFKIQEVTIRKYSLKNHKTFIKSKNLRTKKLALNCYNAYFKAYSQSSYADQMYFFYGQLLFDSKKYLLAVQTYESLMSKFPNSKYVKASYLDQILALEKILPTESQIKKRVGKSKSAIELAIPVKNFIKASLRYIDKFPKEKNTPYIMYQVASFYYQFNQFEPAIRYFKKLSNQYPKSKFANNVNSILLDIYNKNENYTSLEKLALRITKNNKSNKSLRQEARSILEQISFTKAQKLALKKQYTKSAILYEKFAKQHPHSFLAVSAFYNAGLNFEKDSNLLKALEMHSAVLTYKKAKFKKIRQNSTKLLAILYEKLSFYKKAAKAYASYAGQQLTGKEVSDFWYNAGAIFASLNWSSRATQAYTQYIKLSRKKTRHEAWHMLANMYKRHRKWHAAIDYYKKHLKSPSSNKLNLIKSSFFIADIYENKLKQASQASLWHKKTRRLYKKLQTGVSYAARSHFYLVQAGYKKFLQVKIPKNIQAQTQAVKKKIQLLNKLQKSLKPIIHYNNGEHILASLILAAQANQDMAKAIYQAPKPKNLNKKDMIQYKKGINSLIQPYITEAIKGYQLALDKSFKLKTYSKMIRTARNNLATIYTKDDQFVKWLGKPINPEIIPLQVMDLEGSLTKPIFSTGLISKVPKQDLDNLFMAISNNNETQILQAASKILNKKANHQATLRSLALFYVKNNKFALGSLILNRLASVTKKSTQHLIINNLAVIALKQGRVREAVQYLQQALSQSPDYAIAQVNLATIQAQQASYKTSYFYYKTSYKQVLRLWDSTSSKRHILLNNLAVVLVQLKEYNKADVIFKRLLQEQTNQPKILFNYAWFLFKKNKNSSLNAMNKDKIKIQNIQDKLTLYKISYKVQKKLARLSSLFKSRLKLLQKQSIKSKDIQ